MSACPMQVWRDTIEECDMASSSSWGLADSGWRWLQLSSHVVYLINGGGPHVKFHVGRVYRESWRFRFTRRFVFVDVNRGRGAQV